MTVGFIALCALMFFIFAYAILALVVESAPTKIVQQPIQIIGFRSITQFRIRGTADWRDGPSDWFKGYPDTELETRILYEITTS